MKMSKNVIKVVCFGVFFCFLFQNVSWVLRDKSNSEFINGFEDEIPNSLDVLFLGSSMSYRQIYPLQLWDEFGIASYNLGTSEQIIPLSYYVLKHALETQTPKVVVLDMGMCNIDNKHFSDARLHQVWDNLSWSKAKAESINDLAEYPETFYSNIIQYHTRWKSIKHYNFQRHFDMQKGAGCYMNIESFEPVEMIGKDKKQEPPSLTLEYLDKIIAVCESNNIALILTGMPTQQFTESRQKMFHYIEEYVYDKGIDFINFYYLMDELGISWEKDFADIVHLNYDASCKVTNYIGTYLKNNYELLDYRCESKYALWKNI